MIIAFTGAGISKASGIDTFMDRPDIREKLFRDFAISHPAQYRQVIKELKAVVDSAEPNDAHHALYEYGVDVITMNIDGLHEKAGSKPLCLHGTLPDEDELAICDTLYNKPVLYGDAAPHYEKAFEKALELTHNDIFMIIGASDHTAVSVHLKQIAQSKGAKVIDIHADAERVVRETLESLEIDG